MASYLFVFGRKGCAYTRIFLDNLKTIELPFIYIAFDEEKYTKDQYWESVRPFYPTTATFTFPTILLLNEKRPRTARPNPVEHISELSHDEFVVSPWSEMTSVHVFVNLKEQVDTLKPRLRATFGCDSVIAKRMRIIRTVGEIDKCIAANKSFVFCPLQ